MKKYFKVEEDFIVYAFRYCLPRHTYAVSDFIFFADANWKSFSPKIKNLILKETKRYIEEFEEGCYNSFLDRMDCNLWSDFCKRYEGSNLETLQL